MNSILLTFLFIASSYASPMDKMEKRLSAYNEVNSLHCAPSDTPLHNEGLYLDVTCQFNCIGKSIQKERVRGAFIPSERGLFPGNGSTEGNPIWSSVGVSMKTWVQDICLEKAQGACKDYQNIETLSFDKVESGDWSLERFPTCQDKEITLSPFNNSLKVNRILNHFPVLKNLTQNDAASLSDLKLPPKNKKVKKCKKKIKGSICFGDCVEMSSKEFVETLGTQEPLGKSDLEVCGDELHAELSKLNATPAVRKTLCDSYFWNTVIHDQTNIYRSCAAIRGTVDCEGF